ncbi:hypothetical protein [Azospirillum sp.]|uniref:hypothetical protein n=1 Tax=Azospirillum sp. TaxID=34012 RepID=UPI003D70CE0C
MPRQITMTTAVARDWARVDRVAAERTRRTVEKIETLEVGVVVAGMATAVVGMALFPASIIPAVIGVAAAAGGITGGILPGLAEPLALRRHRPQVAKELGLQYAAAPRFGAAARLLDKRFPSAPRPSLSKSLITSLRMLKEFAARTAKSVTALPLLFQGQGPKGADHAARVTVPAVGKPPALPAQAIKEDLSASGKLFACRPRPAAGVGAAPEGAAERAGQAIAARPHQEAERMLTIVDVAMLLQRIAKRRADGLLIPDSMLGRLDRHSNGSLSEYLLALNTREADDLARAKIEQISRLVTHDDPIEGVPTRWAVSQAAKGLPTAARSVAPNVEGPANADFSDRVRGKLAERTHRRGQAMDLGVNHQDKTGTALHPS